MPSKESFFCSNISAFQVCKLSDKRGRLGSLYRVQRGTYNLFSSFVLIHFYMNVVRYLAPVIVTGFMGSVSFAQKNFSEGYVITAAGDTTYGKINNKRSGNDKHNQITFVDKEGNVKTFSAKELRGYSRGDVFNYRTIRDIGAEDFFARVLIEGPVTLLGIDEKESFLNHYYGTNSRNSLYRSYDSNSRYFLCHINKEGTEELRSISFKSKMAEYFSDYEELKLLIENKELQKEDIEIIVSKYNKWYAGK